MRSVFENFRHAGIRTLLAAVLTALALLAPSAGLIKLVIHEPLGWPSFLIAVVVADMILCLYLGLACMVLGYAVAAIKREWSQAELLLRFGGALALIFFTFATLVGTFWRGGPPSGPASSSDS